MTPYVNFDEAFESFERENSLVFGHGAYIKASDVGDFWEVYSWNELPDFNKFKKYHLTIACLEYVGMSPQRILEELTENWNLYEKDRLQVCQILGLNEDYEQNGIFPILILYENEKTPVLIMRDEDLPKGKMFAVLSTNVKNKKEEQEMSELVNMVLMNKELMKTVEVLCSFG